MAEKQSTVVSAAVLSTPPQRRHKCWFDDLTPKQQDECRKAREQIRASGAALRPIARKWVQDLRLLVSARTVAEWLQSHDS